MRYEKKYRVSISKFSSIISHIRELSFKEIYKERYVSSIYYDTLDFKLFRDSIRGISKREKIRLRFYNEECKKIYIEKKIKLGDLGYKIINPLNTNNPYKLINLSIKSSPNKILNGKNILIPHNIEYFYYPVSLVGYLRKYYISNDKMIRITLDKKINYSKIIKKKDNYIQINNIPEKNGVIEIKFEEDKELSKRVINKLTYLFNSNLSRNSKYCNSIELLY